MKLLAHLKRHALLYTLIGIAALVRLLFLFDPHEVWWDSGVYLGMAKYFWSGGTAGLWEHIRPVLWPVVLGAAWWAKLNMIWFARILEFLLTLVSIGLVYVLGLRLFSQRTAIFASIIWAFSSIMFYLGFHEYTELPAVTLILVALLAFVHERWFFAGLLTSLAFLTKFPAGIFVVVLGLVLLIWRRWKALSLLTIGFGLPAAAFLVFNQVMYDTMLGPLIAARESILSVLGCNVLRFNPWYQYLGWIVFDNVFNVFAVVGIAFLARQWKKHVLILLAVLVPALYFMQLHCREYRYLALFLPFIVLLAGHGLERLARVLERGAWRPWVMPALVLMVMAVSVTHGILFYHNNEPRVLDAAAERYYRWLEGKRLEGEIWSSNPLVSVYTDMPVQKMYYPIYKEETAIDFNAYLQKHADRIAAVFLDNCGGGIVCPPDDAECERQLQTMRSFLNERFRQVFFAQSGTCWYVIYTH